MADSLAEAISLIRRLLVTSFATRTPEEHEAARAEALDFLKTHHAERPPVEGSDSFHPDEHALENARRVLLDHQSKEAFGIIPDDTHDAAVRRHQDAFRRAVQTYCEQAGLVDG